MSLDPTTNFVIPEKPETLVSSSSILGYSYDAHKYELFVFYKGKHNSVYRYLMCYPTTFAQVFASGAGIGGKAAKILKTLPKMKVR